MNKIRTMKTTKFSLIIATLFFFACQDDEQAKVTQTLNYPQTSFYEAEFSIDDTPAQNQYYQFKQLANGIEIAERGIFLSDSSIIAKARLKFIDNEYEEVEINFDNGQIAADVMVKKQGKGKYYSYLNSNLVDSIVNTSEDVLFDGPNPSFDYTNALHLLADTNTYVIKVVLINWVTGTLSTERMRFEKTSTAYEITKFRSRRTSIIELNNEPFGIATAEQNNEDYIFNPLKEDPGYFD